METSNNWTFLEQYALQSKDTPLVDFSLYEETNYYDGVASSAYRIKINKVYEEHHALLPKNLSDITGENVLAWIKHRKAPKNRQFIRDILSSINDGPNPLKYVDVTYALSLNDAYWVQHKNWKKDWATCNLYDNPFNESLAYVAFTGCSHRITGLITSPETTTDGQLKKCWQRRQDGIYLLKGDDTSYRAEGRTQAMQEWYAAQVAEVIGFRYVPYFLEEFHHQDGHREIICTCPLFTSSDEGFVDAATYYKAKGVDVHEMDLQLLPGQIMLANAFGKEAYADMMIYDSLICNVDRHLGNYGYLVDNNTGEFTKPAPLFDNGLSLLYQASRPDLENMDTYLQNVANQGVFMPFDTGVKYFVQKRHLEGLRKLTSFQFKRHPRYNIAEPTIKKMEYMVQYRARRALQLYHERETEKQHRAKNQLFSSKEQDPDIMQK